VVCGFKPSRAASQAPHALSVGDFFRPKRILEARKAGLTEKNSPAHLLERSTGPGPRVRRRTWKFIQRTQSQLKTGGERP
jgi:hypothetical protein